MSESEISARRSSGRPSGCKTEREPFNRGKLKALVHYVIWKAGGRAGIGATQLYKIAWFSDAQMFMLMGASITGAEYVRKERGPVPVVAEAVTDELRREGKIEGRQGGAGDGGSGRFRAKSKPDAAGLTKAETEVADEWIGRMRRDPSAAATSQETHDYGWRIAAVDEPLPFQAFLASRIRKQLTDEERERLRAEARRRSLP